MAQVFFTNWREKMYKKVDDMRFRAKKRAPLSGALSLSLQFSIRFDQGSELRLHLLGLALCLM